MSQNTSPQGAWRVEADTLPSMQYEHYRDTLIHETNDIRDFLALRQTGRTTLVAPKGYGKTLLLIAKKKSFLEAKSGILMAENLFIDRPTGAFPILTQVRVDQLSMDYEFWKSLWKVAIALAAIKAFVRATKDQSLNKSLSEVDHIWYRKILRDESKYFEAGELFTDLMTQDYRSIVTILDNSNFLFPNLNRINTSIVFFIDNVDEYCRSVLEDHSHSRNPNRLFRNRNNMIWALAQIALTSTAYELEKSNHHIKIFCTMRHEAFLRMSEVESDAFQITGSRCLQIKYSKYDLEQIFLKNIEITPQDRLVEPQSTDLMSRFVGSNNQLIRHRFVPQMERVFDFFLRHSLYRPRDLMYIGGEIAKIDPPLRSAKTIQEAVDASTGAIIESIFAEMRPFFAVPVRRKLFPHIPSNVLSLDQLKNAAQQYISDLGEDTPIDPDHEALHPFCVLYKLGLLGYVSPEFQDNPMWRQSFLQPTQIRMSNTVGLPSSRYYLIHPALDQGVHDMSPGFSRLYHRQNIIGNQLRWEDPVTYMFAVKGDMVGYSDVMNSEMYEVVTRKLHEWAQAVCRDVIYAEVTGGDSILLIDHSPGKLVHYARQLIRLAAEFHERPMKMRFGGAAGPIVFERIPRLYDGTWASITIPMGLALRTSARLEPYAAPGHLLVEDKFYDFGRSRAAGLHDVGTDGAAGAEGLDENAMVAVSEKDVRALKYDPKTERFALQKNPLDPPYYTKLWQIKLI